MTKHFSPSRIAMLVAGAALIGSAVPAIAQSDEEMVVTGRYGSVPDSAKSLSQTVSYADLDLSTAGGRAEFRHRLRLTARYLCGKLGENETGSAGVGPSCRDAAVQDAMSRAGTLEAHAAPRGTTWVASSAWAAPYPGEWVSRYPD